METKNDFFASVYHSTDFFHNLAKNKKHVYSIAMQGNGHLEDSLPCQDFCLIEGWLVWCSDCMVAVLADGAGSKENSLEGAFEACIHTCNYFDILIHDKIRNNSSPWLPDSQTWKIEIKKIMDKVLDDIKKIATEEGADFKSFASTFMLLYYTPERTYFAHIGDGRAGVKINGEWQSIMTPHRNGNQSDGTVFLTHVNDCEEIVWRDICGVDVPETTVIESPIEAFVMMSDGCENGLWRLRGKEIREDGSEIVVRANQPFEPALDALIEKLNKTGIKRTVKFSSTMDEIVSQCIAEQEKRDEEEKKALYDFVLGYNKNLLREQDDKSLILGIIE
jgi:hypothetical protein